MIVGVGTDLCEVARVARAIARTGDRFLERVYTPAERLAAEASVDPPRELARLFALKEACFKALGGGWPADMSFTDVDASGGGLRLSGRAAERGRLRRAQRLTSHASTSRELAVAVVVAEAP